MEAKLIIEFQIDGVTKYETEVCASDHEAVIIAEMMKTGMDQLHSVLKQKVVREIETAGT